MSANERAALDQANMTIGRQDWSSDGRMLGAGTGPNANFSEIGLSADPRAMGHGIKPMPMPQSTTAAAATSISVKPTVGSSGSSSSSDTRAVRDAGMRVYAAAPAGAQSSSPPATVAGLAKTLVVPASTAQPQRQQHIQQQQQQRNVGRQQHQQQQQQQQGTSSQQQASSGGAKEEPGKAKRVAPSGQAQRSWYASAWHLFRSAVWGTPVGLMQLGPPWTKWPDYDRLNNTNALLAGLWPSVSEAVRQQLLDMVPGMMQQAAKDYGAGYLTDLRLVDFELGELPPRLDGMKVYDDHVGDMQLMMEVAASWGSSSKVSIGATLQLFGHTFKVPLTVQKLQFHAVARISAQPMLPHYPYLGSVGVSLIEPPFVDFELPLGGIDVMALPMLRGAVRMATQLAARQYVVFPRGITVPLVPAGAQAGGPCGMLEVGLVRVAGLRSEDLIGHSDPYVILRLREGREVRSRTVDNNNNPEFNQVFKMLVDDTESQVLQIIVMDADIVSSQDKVIGVAQVPLKTAACVAMPRTRVPLSLTIHKLMAPQQGIGGILELPIRVAGLPITAAATGGRMIYQNLAGALGVGSAGKGGSKNDGRYDEVLDETGWLGPSEEYWEEQGVYGRDAAARGRTDDGGEGRSRDAPARQPAAAPPPAAKLVPTSDPAVAAALGPAAAASSSSSSPFGGQALKIVRPAGGAAAAGAAAVPGGSSSSSRPVCARRLSGDGAPHGSGLDRLASRSAPLSGFPESSAPAAGGDTGSGQGGRGMTEGQAAAAEAASPPEMPEVRGPSMGPGKPAMGTQQQEEQQQKEKEQKEKDQKEQLQSMQGTATGKDAKNLGGTQVKPVHRGTAFLELTYTPFRRPEGQPTGAGASPAASLLAVGLGRPKPTDMGILTVTVIRARGLTGWQHEADPYVTLGLMETAGEDNGRSGTAGATARLSMREEQRSKTVYNEASPRFNEKFDFIMVPASSVLLVTVWDQTTMVEAVVSLSVSKERFRDQVLGRVKVPVMDVAAAGRVRSSWPLQGAMMGELELILQWIPKHLVA
ncbi:hypothetical protein COO60DRAFT_1700585 [Scenedesmus sp. NREL 46B-D3]|nr:hypothetical protein COO60DRAFT_1700585 [Scenedesmus sp. NREL 46B-D3]